MPIIKENNLNSLKKPTVLILGAGASNPYGFPLGSELKDIMLEQINTLAPLLRSPNINVTLVNKFWEVFRNSKLQIIDIFLEKKKKFREIGSYVLAITIMLSECKTKSKLVSQTGWYDDLFNTLKFEDEDPNIANLSIVTINYDRSLEYFLTENIKCNCDDDMMDFALKKLRKIKVIHAHGSIGIYPQIEYGTSPNNLDALKDATYSIKIVSDRLEDSADFQEAQKIISKAERIIFLGFGYDVRILDTLLTKTVLKEKKIYGTAYKLAKKKRGFLADYFDNQITLGNKNQGCQAFLKLIGLTR